MGRHTIGLQIGAAELRAVTLRRRHGRPEVVAAERCPLSSVGELPARLQTALPWLEAFLRKWPGARVTVSLPPGTWLSRIMELPPVTGATLEDVMKYEAADAVPFSSEELVHGFVPLSAHPELTRVLVGFARPEAVAQIVQWLAAAGGKARRVTVSPVAYLPLLQASANPCEPLTRPEGGADVTLLLAVEADGAEILLTRNGELELSRSVFWNTETDRNRLLEEAVQEIRRTLQGLRARHRQDILGRILFCGEDAQFPETMARVESEFGVPVGMVDPWQRLGGAGAQGALSQRDRGLFACATGLALQEWTGTGSLNLMPEREKSLLDGESARVVWRAAAAAACLASLGFWLVYGQWSPISVTRRLERRYLQARVVGESRLRERERPENSRVPRQYPQALASLSQEIHRDSVTWLEVLRLLSERLPEGMVLSELTMAKGQSVALRGTTRDNVEVAEALRVMQEIPVFVEVRLNYASSVRAGETQRIEVEIVATLEPPGETKVSETR